MHENRVEVTAQTAAALVREQFPQWGDAEVRPVRSDGSINAVFRIGDALAARFPLRLADPGETRAVLEQEARASAELAQVSPFPTPVPVALGEPGPGYPMPWAVQTWLPGTVASEAGADPGASEGFARDLAAFLATLRKADTRGRRFEGEPRGGDFTRHDAWMETCLVRSEGLVDVTRLRAMWARLRLLPHTAADVMSHRDLIPGNVLVADGRLAGVLDGGGFGPADPALDLLGAWHLLERGPREVLRAELDCDDLEWERGKAWAFQHAIDAAWYLVESNPAASRMFCRTLARLLDAEE
jgi:aminoglycoside phosphotransferase (APT) family kinase protein